MTFSPVHQDLCHMQAYHQESHLSPGGRPRQRASPLLSEHLCTRTSSSSGEKNLAAGPPTEPSSLEGDPCKSLGTKAGSYLGKLIYLRARPGASHHLTLIALTYWPSVVAAEAKSLKLDTLKTSGSSMSSATNAGIQAYQAVGIVRPVPNLAQWAETQYPSSQMHHPEYPQARP